MHIQFAVKSLAKKALNIQVIDLPDFQSPDTLQSLITQLVKQQATAFNARMQNTDTTALPDHYLDILMNTGKVSFGEKYNTTTVDITTAQDNALQAFDDGLYAVFINDDAIESLDSMIDIDEQSVISLIRLTFLTGSYW